MHPYVMDFIALTPQKTGRVLEIGSMNVNGSPRPLFKGAEYTGVDFREGPGVDVVLDAAKLPERFPLGHFDVVVCVETLEHCEHWRDVLASAWAMVAGHGYLTLTVPLPSKSRHNYPNDYWRWTQEQIEGIFAKQEIVHKARKWVGVIVKKQTDELDMSCEPAKVK